MPKLIPAFLLAASCVFGAEVGGVPNFHQVDDHLYRGAQPTPSGFRNLAQIGVRTVIDLRQRGDAESAQEERIVNAAGMHYIHIGLSGYHAPSEDQVSLLLKTIDKQSGAVFIHCKRGADRTGTAVACYRIARQNWPNDKALAEAKQYGMSRTEVSMRNFVRHFQAAAAGIAAQAIPAAAGAL